MRCPFLALIVKTRMAFPSLPMILKTCLCRQMGSSSPLPNTTVPIRQRLKISLIGSLDLRVIFGIPSQCCCWQPMMVIGVPKLSWNKPTTESQGKILMRFPVFPFQIFRKPLMKIRAYWIRNWNPNSKTLWRYLSGSYRSIHPAMPIITAFSIKVASVIGRLSTEPKHAH